MMVQWPVGVLVLALFLMFCVRHFFIQLMAIKLFIDALVFILTSLRKADQMSSLYHAVAWLVSSLSCMVFFVLMASATKRFQKPESLDLEEDDE